MLDNFPYLAYFNISKLSLTVYFINTQISYLHINNLRMKFIYAYNFCVFGIYLFKIETCLLNIAATFKEAINILGGLDILINNVDVINEINFSKAIDINVTTVIRGTLLGIQQMRKDSGGKGGVIVNISSIAGLRAASHLPVYSATKHAVVSFSRSFAQPYHYNRTNVKVIVLCPGMTGTPVLEDLPQDISSADILQKYRPQRVESVAHGLIYVIRCAQNGSVWINEDGKPVYEVQLPDTLPQKKTEIDMKEN
ncbi:hypothetical protein ACFW04_001872 [Cataglyphis niger]